jgi:hypothetical protein
MSLPPELNPERLGELLPEDDFSGLKAELSCQEFLCPRNN